MIKNILALCMIGIITGIALSTPALARYKHLKIESRFDPNKYVIVPVRRAYDGGLEVRLPGGTWIHCARNCEWTVQKQYLDFFEFQQSPFGPGYLRFSFGY